MFLLFLQNCILNIFKSCPEFAPEHCGTKSSVYDPSLPSSFLFYSIYTFPGSQYSWAKILLLSVARYNKSRPVEAVGTYMVTQVALIQMSLL